jgi:hypothetical protein
MIVLVLMFFGFVSYNKDRREYITTVLLVRNIDVDGGFRKKKVIEDRSSNLEYK